MISKQTTSSGIFVLLIYSIALNFLSFIFENSVYSKVLTITKLLSVLLLMILIVIFQPRWVYWWRKENKQSDIKSDVNLLSIVLRVIAFCCVCFAIISIFVLIIYFLF